MARIRSKSVVRHRGGIPVEITAEGLDSEVWSDADLVLGFCDAYGLPAPEDHLLGRPRACRDHAAQHWALVNGYLNKYGSVHWGLLSEVDVPAIGNARIRAKVEHEVQQQDDAGLR